MAKRYDINSITGTEFTYQLYTNMNPQISGESTVACDAEATPGDFFASFTVSDITTPVDPIINRNTVQFRVGGSPINDYNALANSPSNQPPEFSYNYGFSVSANPNGDYIIYKNGTLHTVYKDGVEVGSVTVGTSAFADNFIVDEDPPNPGQIINVVLGS